MREANMTIRLRSWCAHHVMPLQKCRSENFWLPYKCEHEREMFEKCRYKEYAKQCDCMFVSDADPVTCGATG